MIKYFVVALLLFCLAAPSDSMAQAKKPVTLHGEIVDLIGYVSSGKMQEAEAITRSAQAGSPLGFLDTKSKKLYVVGLTEVNKGANSMLLPYVGTRVFVTGKVYTKNGVNAILITDIGKSIK